VREVEGRGEGWRTYKRERRIGRIAPGALSNIGAVDVLPAGSGRVERSSGAMLIHVDVMGLNLRGYRIDMLIWVYATGDAR
jgi:hypothetical protein